MLGGARRPPPPDYLALFCRALTEVLRIDKRLRPFMAEQGELLERLRRDQEVRAALDKIYGKDDADAVPARPIKDMSLSLNQSQLLKEELALAKTHLLLESLRTKLGNR
jgi:hypothetical protein